MRITRRRELWRQSLVVFVIGCFALLPVAPAFAHGGGDSNQSRILVLDALSYLANQSPHYADEAMDKVKDALMAKDQSGVNMGPLTMAKQAMDAGQMMQARVFLQRSLQPMMGQVMGDEPGTTMMLDPLKGSTNGGGSRGLLVGASALAVLAGLVLASLWRPPESLLKLRSHMTGGIAR
jgi:Tfp pilus assembly protein PilF